MPIKLVTTIEATVIAKIAMDIARLFSKKIRKEEDASVFRFFRFFRKNRFRSALNCSDRGMRVGRNRIEKIQFQRAAQLILAWCGLTITWISVGIIGFNNLLHEVVTDYIGRSKIMEANALQGLEYFSNF